MTIAVHSQNQKAEKKIRKSPDLFLTKQMMVVPGLNIVSKFSKIFIQKQLGPGPRLSQPNVLSVESITRLAYHILAYRLFEFFPVSRT